MAPDPGLLRATKEGGKPQTQLRWVSRVQGGAQTRTRRVSRVRTRPRFAPAAAPRTLRAPWAEMAPDPGLLRATKEGGKSQTQLRWVSQARRWHGALKRAQGAVAS